MYIWAIHCLISIRAVVRGGDKAREIELQLTKVGARDNTVDQAVKWDAGGNGSLHNDVEFAWC